MSSSEAGAHAYNPAVLVNGEEITPTPPRTSQQQEYLDALADQTERAVESIKEKLAGMQESLKAAKSEAERARADARNEGN